MKLSLKSGKNGGPMHNYEIIALNSSQKLKMFLTKFVRKLKTTIYVQQLLSENRIYYE